jgi:Ca2+-binding EF-hand superfamily protein
MKRAILGSIAAAAIAAAPLAMPLWAQEGDLFGKLDKNSDGVVTADEVEGDAKGLFERSVRRGDKNGDKQLTKEEFAAAQSEGDAPRQPLGQDAGGPGRRGGFPDPRELLERLDVNKDGKISKDEARGPLGEGFDRLDANRDGALSEEELRRMAGRRPDGGPPGGAPGIRRSVPQLEEQFGRLDANSDGRLTKEEMSDGQRQTFGRMLERAGGSITKEQFVRMAQDGQPGFGPPVGGRPPLFVALDADDDGELSTSEIEAASKALLTLDRNEDGKLSREELFPLGPATGFNPARLFDRERFQSNLKAADSNGDGKLSKDEVDKSELFEVFKSAEGFARIDRNKDGLIDQEELQPFLRIGDRPGPDRLPEGDRPPDRPAEGRPEDRRPGDRPGDRRPADGRPGLGRFSPEEFQARLKEADKNGDGQLSKEEAPPMLQERFDRIDANGDGMLDEAELRQMLRRLREGGDRRPDRPERRPDAPR